MTSDLLVVFDSWKAAGRSFGKAALALGNAADHLCHELTAAGAAWGHDDLARAFFSGGEGKPGFGTSRDQVLPQIGDMVNVLAGTGDALVAAGAGYLAAEQSNARLAAGRPAGGFAGTPTAGGSSYHLPPFTTAATVNDPPPAGLDWMMNLVASLVAGCEWPDGSICGLEQISGALSGMGSALGQAIQDVSDASAQVTGRNDGQGAQCFAAFCGVLIEALDQLQNPCQGLTSSVDNLIAQKKAAWIQLVASMVFLVASFFVAQALATWTLGASEAEFFATAEAEGWRLRTFVRLLAKGVLEGLWYGAGMDAVGQVSRIITGAQHGFDWAELAKAGGEGAVAGVVMSSLSGAARLAGGRSAVGKALFAIMDGKVGDGEPGALDKLAGFGARVGFNSATGFAGNVASQAAFDDGDVNWTQAGAFAVGMAVMGEGINLAGTGKHAADQGTDAPGQPDPSGTTGTDVLSAADEARPPPGVQAALTTTLRDSTAEPALEPATPVSDGEHADTVPIITAGHDGPSVRADPGNSRPPASGPPDDLRDDHMDAPQPGNRIADALNKPGHVPDDADDGAVSEPTPGPGRHGHGAAEETARDNTPNAGRDAQHPLPPRHDSAAAEHDRPASQDRAAHSDDTSPAAHHARHPDSGTPGASRVDIPEQFLDTVAHVERWLDGEQIPHAMFGSLAAHAYIDEGRSLDFNRPHAHDPTERVPDIDLLVPRSRLHMIRPFIEAVENGDFPVHIDTFWSECWVDLRPNAEYSYLTHRQLRLPVRTELFSPARARLFGQEITTLDPRTLLGLYGTVGVLRKKDVPRVTGLIDAIASGAAPSRFTEQDSKVFDDFMHARKRGYPAFVASKRAWAALTGNLPAPAAQALKHYVGLPANEVRRVMNRGQR